MKSDQMRGRMRAVRNRLWFRIFLNVGVIFVVFVLILAVANGTMLVNFFCLKQKTMLLNQLEVVAKLDTSDRAAVSETLSDISDKYNFEVEIYDSSGHIKYTTHGSQMMDYFTFGRDNFTMSHEDLVPIKTEELGNGVIYETAIRRFDRNEFLLCYKSIGDGLYAELRIQKELITASAQIANEFIMLVAALCFVLAIVWVFLFARKFSRPIAMMNDITHDMAKQDFTRKLEIDRKDEIGQLAGSINEMSDSLSAALTDLKASNAKLRNEIELERQLDVMRRGFVANVSHELKTPIAIISGYAEGLKLNINAQSKEDYCNTIIDESARMNKLVLSILELSRYESGQISVNRQNFDVSVLSGELLHRIFSASDVITENKIPAGTMICADPMQIEQVLKSYLENARSHTPQGGAVTVSADAVDSKTLRVSVHNTGSHVDEAVMPQIWQSFFRGDTSHKRESSRFGLGLSIVSAIMKMHGRACGVSNTDDGVTFWFDADPAENPQLPDETNQQLPSC